MTDLAEVIAKGGIVGANPSGSFDGRHDGQVSWNARSPNCSAHSAFVRSRPASRHANSTAYSRRVSQRWTAPSYLIRDQHRSSVGEELRDREERRGDDPGDEPPVSASHRVALPSCPDVRIRPPSGEYASERSRVVVNGDGWTHRPAGLQVDLDQVSARPRPPRDHHPARSRSGRCRPPGPWCRGREREPDSRSTSAQSEQRTRQNCQADFGGPVTTNAVRLSGPSETAQGTSSSLHRRAERLEGRPGRP